MGDPADLLQEPYELPSRDLAALPQPTLHLIRAGSVRLPHDPSSLMICSLAPHPP